MLEQQAVRQQPPVGRQQAVRQQPPVGRQQVVRQPPVGRQQVVRQPPVKQLLTAVSASSPMLAMPVVRQQLVKPQAVCLRA